MALNIKPLGDRVVIEPLEEDEATFAGGQLVLPIAQVVYGCYAALEAYNGRPFRYRWVADLIDRYEAQA